MNGTMWCIVGDTRRKACQISAFLTTNPIWNDPALKPGVCCEKPATNRLFSEQYVQYVCSISKYSTKNGFFISTYSPHPQKENIIHSISWFLKIFYKIFSPIPNNILPYTFLHLEKHFPFPSKTLLTIIFSQLE